MAGRDSELLSALTAITRIARSLYGPGKARKHITDPVTRDARFTSDAYEIMKALNSEHAATALLHEALDEQRRSFGTRCTTLINVCNVLGEAALDLQRRGVPVDTIRKVLTRAEATCLKTLKKMRMPVSEVIDGFETLERATQLKLLGEKLQTQLAGESIQEDVDGLSLSMRLAAEILTEILASNRSSSSSALVDESFNIDNVLAFQIALGGPLGGVASSQVFSGALVPVGSEHSARIRHAFQLERNFKINKGAEAAIEIRGGIVAINGDFALPQLGSAQDPQGVSDGCAIQESVRIVFCYGEVDAGTMDSCWTRSLDGALSVRRSIRCVVVDSFKELVRIAELCDAQIVDSWIEIQPEAVGNESIELRLVEISTPRLAGGLDDDDDDEVRMNFRGTRTLTKLFLNVARSSDEQRDYTLQTLLVRGSTRTEAEELQQQVKKSLRRLVNALKSGYLLPSSGSYLGACAAEVRVEAQKEKERSAEPAGDTEIASAVMEQIVEAFNKLSITLLQNTGQASDRRSRLGGSDFLSHYARVRAIQANYLRGIQDSSGDDTKFYATCHFGGSDFCVLSTTSSLSFPKRKSRFDDYKSVQSAFRKSFRLVDLALSVAAYQVNQSAAPPPKSQ